MPQHADQQCFRCQRMRPYEILIPSEMLRPALQETIKKHDPSWLPGQMLCVDCLDLLREEYVEDALTEEIGELTQLEQEVIRSMKEQETLTENINVAFEKNVTFGQRIADHVASFGGSWIFIGAFFLVLATWIAINSVSALRHPLRSLSLYTFEFDSVLSGGHPGADHHDESKPHRNQRPAALRE